MSEKSIPYFVTSKIFWGKIFPPKELDNTIEAQFASLLETNGNELEIAPNIKRFLIKKMITGIKGNRNKNIAFIFGKV